MYVLVPAVPQILCSSVVHLYCYFQISKVLGLYNLQTEVYDTIIENCNKMPLEKVLKQDRKEILHCFSKFRPRAYFILEKYLYSEEDKNRKVYGMTK